MRLSAEQVKGRIRNLAKINDADARLLLRYYMFERLFERIENSKYRDHFIIKGGFLIIAMVGIKHRSTNDIDVTIKNETLSIDDIERIMKEIIDVDIDDGVSFELDKITTIMSNLDYPGTRVSFVATLDRMSVPLKIDVSTGDVITPNEIRFNYKLLLEDREIQIWSYNIETVLAQKLQTILVRGVLNTRMRDYYDVYILSQLYKEEINYSVLKEAFIKTCSNRGTDYLIGDNRIINTIESDVELKRLWNMYRDKYSYSLSIDYEDIIKSIRLLLIKMELM